jgi:hypothetical protein
MSTNHPRHSMSADTPTKGAGQILAFFQRGVPVPQPKRAHFQLEFVVPCHIGCFLPESDFGPAKARSFSSSISCAHQASRPLRESVTLRRGNGWDY